MRLRSLIALVVIVSSSIVARVHAATTELITLGVGGVPADGDTTSAAMTPDGRFVAFASAATNLVMGDSNAVCDNDSNHVFDENCPDVFLHDRQTHVTTLVSVDALGALANGASANPDISADGRWLAFESSASNLVPNDTNDQVDCFLRNLDTGVTERVSVTNGGAQANGANCRVSNDGRFVVFSSRSNAFSSQSDIYQDVFLRDRQLGTTRMLSYGGNLFGDEDCWEGDSLAATISGDGNFVLFRHDEDASVCDTNTRMVFLFDRVNNVWTRLRLPSGIMTVAGRLVGDSWFTLLIKTPGDPIDRVYVRDLTTGTTEEVSVSSTGERSNETNGAARVTPDGRFVVFNSWGSNLVPDDTNVCAPRFFGCEDVFVRDREAETTERVSLTSSNGESNGVSLLAGVSADGRDVLFLSDATNLIPVDPNAHRDLFVRAAVCGDGIVDRGEECDDGNSVSDDGCSSACLIDCPSSPLPACREPIQAGRSTLQIVDRTPDGKDRFQWRWLKGAVTPKSAFGHPDVADDYRLCVYDTAGVALAMGIPAGGGWKEKSTSFKYKSKSGLPDGITSALLKEGLSIGKAKILLKGKGAPLALPSLSSLVPPLTVQLSNAAGECWQAFYRNPMVKTDGSQLKVKSDPAPTPTPTTLRTATPTPRPSGCGNDSAEPGEVCDGTDLRGESCTTLGFAGGTVTCGASCAGFDTSACQLPGSPPPDPATVVPPVDPSIVTPFETGAAFLADPHNGLQYGVGAGTLDPRRIAIIRGNVSNDGGSPIPTVRITILDHPEFGATLSRADGVFDLAVNGGGSLVVRYEKSGYLPVQRTIDVPWQDFAVAPPVVLIPYDATVTAIDLTDVGTAHVARGSLISDARGTRRPTLYFPPGTQAAMELANGSAQPLASLDVRLTEYTVGSNGPRRMPGDLPPTSAYTYALEFSVDQAVAAGAKQVRFGSPVHHYVENFLGFPVGTDVPTAYLDRDTGIWVPTPDGRVVKILGISDELAELDSDGDDIVDNGTAIGVTSQERAALAGMYAAGQSLWRMPIPHFSPYDGNYGASVPGGGPPPGVAGPDGVDGTDDDCPESGSIIGCESRVLGETLPIAGTSLSLRYSSDRVSGYSYESKLNIPVIGSSVPAALNRIELQIEILGRVTRQTFSPLPNQSTGFVWDGFDAWGRRPKGKQPVSVIVTYVYDGFYNLPPYIASSFGYPSGVVVPGDMPAVVRRERRYDATLSSDTGSSWHALGQGVGGWTISGHNAYDARGKTVHLGSGGRRSGRRVDSNVIHTVLDHDEGTGLIDGIPYPIDMAVGDDGSIYLVDNDAPGRVWRLFPNGERTVVAGGEGPPNAECTAGEGGPATDAPLYYPTSIALGRDGVLYIGDQCDGRVLRVDSNGVLTRFAGGGSGNSGDGGPALAAGFSNIDDLAVGPDGSVYVADADSHRVRRVAPDGIISTFAGNGGAGDGGDGGPATSASIASPARVTVGPDGSVYVYGNTNYTTGVLRRVTPDGIIATVAGTNGVGSLDMGIAATGAEFGAITGVAVARDGSLIVCDGDPDYHHRVVKVSPAGTVYLLAGKVFASPNLPSGDGGPAGNATLIPDEVAISPDGTILVFDQYNLQIRGISSWLPDANLSDAKIASEDGLVLDRYDSFGRHLQAISTLTGAVRRQYGYDAGGRVVTIADGDGNVTQIERDLQGRPTAIVAPFGQRTTLQTDANGYLASVTNPAGEATVLAYVDGGLLSSLTTPRSQTTQFSYDGDGRFTHELDSAGGSKTLTRSPTPQGYEVAVTTGLSRTTRYRVDRLPSNDMRRTVVAPSGIGNSVRLFGTGATIPTLSDGRTASRTFGPDPRFGMQSRIPNQTTISTPGGISFSKATSRVISPPGSADPLAVTQVVNGETINGVRTTTNAFERATRTFTTSSPAGRQHTLRIDDQGRPILEERAGLTAVQYEYDPRGRLSRATQGTRIWQYGYDARGNASSILDPLGRTTSFGYDAADRVTSETRPDTSVVAYGYDAGGNLTSVTPPGRPPHRFTYTPLDLLESYQPPDLPSGSTWTQHVYSVDRELVSVVRPDNVTLVSEYDNAGRLQASRAQPADVTLRTYAYDAVTDLLRTVDVPGVVRLDLDYDASLPIRQTWTGVVSGVVEVARDNDLRIASRATSGGATTTLGYDADGLLVQAVTQGSVPFTIDHDPASGFIVGTTLGQVTTQRSFTSFGEVAVASASFNGAPLFTQTFGYDAGGRIQTIVESDSGGTDTYAYGYDLAGRLETVTINGALYVTYQYDANGNRLSETLASGPVTAATYDVQDRLLSYGSSDYAYTANGDLDHKTHVPTGETVTYGYDAFGALAQVAFSGGPVIDYVIDGLGRRMARDVDGARDRSFLYGDAGEPVAELSATGTLVSQFVYGTRANVPDYIVRGGSTYRVITDQLGSARLVVDVASGNVTQALKYDAFGKVMQDTNPGFQPFGFAGGIADPETGLVQFGAREYDPQVGRWITKDPLRFSGGDSNLYSYVVSDPVNARDQNGLWPVHSPVHFDPPSLEEVGERLTGAVDAETLGGTERIRDALGVDDDWLHCSSDYNQGHTIGAVARDVDLLIATRGRAGALRAVAPGSDISRLEQLRLAAQLCRMNPSNCARIAAQKAEAIYGKFYAKYGQHMNDPEKIRKIAEEIARLADHLPK